MSRVTHIQHFATYKGLSGIAELVRGSGYLFRAHGASRAMLVAYTDVNLVLLGLVDLADTQHELDELLGGPAQVACTREQGIH